MSHKKKMKHICIYNGWFLESDILASELGLCQQQ